MQKSIRQETLKTLQVSVLQWIRGNNPHYTVSIKPIYMVQFSHILHWYNLDMGIFKQI